MSRRFAGLLLLAWGPACDDDTTSSSPRDAARDSAPADAGDSAPGGDAGDGAAAVAHTLFATEGETLIAIDVATGMPRSGAIGNLQGPTDLQATSDGYLAVNLTDANEVLLVDARTFAEVARVKSSALGATRPVHGFLTPRRSGKQYWVANNDGAGTAATNSVVFIDVVPGSASFAKAVGEIGLGIGHHKNAFSPAQPRISISNIADCDNVVQVIDYADPALPKLVKKWSAAELDPARMCSAMMGVTPDGAAAAHNGHGFHNLTGWGTILSVDQDAAMPSFKLLPTAGTGAGYTKLGHDGLYIYSLQRTPREADAAKPGAPCQIGQLVVVDAHGDAVAGQVPILLTGPTCTAALPTYAAPASPDHIKISKDGRTMFITTQTGAAPMGMPETYSDQLVVFDLTDGAHPVQKPSVTVGKHTGQRAMAVTGDGKWLFVVNNSDKTVSQVDATTLSITRTITLKAAPAQLASWGSAEGPSSQSGPQ